MVTKFDPKKIKDINLIFLYIKLKIEKKFFYFSIAQTVCYLNKNFT